MISVNTIKSEVDKKVNEKTPLLLAFLIKEFERREEIEIMRKRKGFNQFTHIRFKNNAGYTNGCGCPYCQSLHRYVDAKLVRHRMIRRFDNPDYEYGPYAAVAETEKIFYNNLESTENKIQTLKAIKDSWKKKLGITKNM